MKHLLEEYGITIVELLVGACILTSFTLILVHFNKIALYIQSLMLGE